MASTEQVWIADSSGRVEQREPASVSADCRSGMKRSCVDVVNISRTGAKIVTLDPVQAGSTFWMKLPNLEPLEMSVVWSKGLEAGCRFLKPLHPAIFRVIAQAVRR
jgi:hypothetical protein